MKKLTIFLLLATILFTGCINNGPKANTSDLQVVSGIRDRKLILEGTEGMSTTFSFRANYDWSIIDYEGFTCDPSSGTKSALGETITVTATPLRSNNTADTIRLSDLNFKMLSTRFVGISAYQLPQICMPKGNKICVDAVRGSKGKLTIVSSCENITIEADGDITASLGEKNDRNEYVVTETANNENLSASNQHIGSVYFEVNGVMQEGRIEVEQTSALVLDRSEVLLPGKAGGENIIVIDSDFEFDVSTTSENFDVTANGKNTFTVTAKSDNTTGKTLSLGEIAISLSDTPECQRTIEVKQRKAKASQTIIVHFVGTALHSYYDHNISKIIEALDKNIQGDAQIVVITTETNTKGTLYELRYDSKLGKAVKEKVKTLLWGTPYDHSILEDNICAALNFAPAEKYALVIGSHGLGWIPVENTPNQISRELSLPGQKPAEIWKRNENAEMTRHFGDSSDTRYDVSELAQAIRESNIELEYLLFDACFMGNIESAYDLRHVTKHIIGSPCEVMGYGFPYARIMKHMLTNGGTSYNLDKICSEYVDYYKTEAVTHSACVALTNTSELEALAEAMKEVFKADEKANFSLDKVQYYEGISPHVFYDLEHIVELSCADANAVAKFKAQLKKTVTSRYHTDSFYSAYSSGNSYYHAINYYSGISTSYKSKTYEYDWKNTAWYKATH